MAGASRAVSKVCKVAAMSVKKFAGISASEGYLRMRSNLATTVTSQATCLLVAARAKRAVLCESQNGLKSSFQTSNTRISASAPIAIPKPRHAVFPTTIWIMRVSDVNVTSWPSVADVTLSFCRWRRF